MPDPPAGTVAPEAAPASAAETPRPRASVAQLILTTLALLFAAWAASDVLIPMLLAMFLALIGNPIIRLLQRLYVPRFIGGALVLGLGLAAAVLLVDRLAQPAGNWIAQAPAQLRQLEPRLRSLMQPVREASSAAQAIAQLRAGGGGGERGDQREQLRFGDLRLVR